MQWWQVRMTAGKTGPKQFLCSEIKGWPLPQTDVNFCMATEHAFKVDQCAGLLKLAIHNECEQNPISLMLPIALYSTSTPPPPPTWDYLSMYSQNNKIQLKHKSPQKRYLWDKSKCRSERMYTGLLPSTNILHVVLILTYYVYYASNGWFTWQY